METRNERKESLRGGNGHVDFKHLLGETEMNGKCRLFAELKLERNCSIGYHVHQGESETYYILSGEGVYNDNGASKPVKAGDVTFTASGCGHALINSGTADLVFIALIILDNQ